MFDPNVAARRAFARWKNVGARGLSSNAVAIEGQVDIEDESLGLVLRGELDRRRFLITGGRGRPKGSTLEVEGYGTERLELVAIGPDGWGWQEEPEAVEGTEASPPGADVICDGRCTALPVANRLVRPAADAPGIDADEELASG